MRSPYPFGLTPGHFAQQPGTDGKVVFSQPKTRGLTKEAQDMIDMFSELDVTQCNNLANVLANENDEGAGFWLREYMNQWLNKTE